MAVTLNYDFGNDYVTEPFDYEVADNEAVGMCFDKLVNDYFPKGVWATMNEAQKNAVYDLLRGMIEDYELGEEVVETYMDDLTDDFEEEAWDEYKDSKRR